MLNMNQLKVPKMQVLQEAEEHLQRLFCCESEIDRQLINDYYGMDSGDNLQEDIKTVQDWIRYVKKQKDFVIFEEVV